MPRVDCARLAAACRRAAMPRVDCARLTAARVVEARHREHLERPAEVEHLDVGEDEDADVSARRRHAADLRRLARAAAPNARTIATISGGCFSGDPASNGGSGSYSMPSWMPRARSSP